MYRVILNDIGFALYLWNLAGIKFLSFNLVKGKL